MTTGPDPGADAASQALGPCYECGVCWSVYDPALGDPFAQVLPGTPFAALPAHWNCPHCDAPKARFMAVTP